jgi:hypothetical protein
MTDSPSDQEGNGRGTEALVFAVAEGKRISLGVPNLLALGNGRLLVAFDQMGPDVKGLSGKRGHDARRNHWLQGRVMSSVDGGASWQLSATYPFRRASLFRAGGDLYLVGEISGGLSLMRSPDGGGSWSAPMEVTGDLNLCLCPTTVFAQGESWLIPCQQPSGGGWGMTFFRAPKGASLMNRKAWTQGPLSPPLAALLPDARKAGFGVPASEAPVTWKDPLLIQVEDAAHPWHQAGHLHLLAATQCGRQHWGAFLVLDTSDLTLAPQALPSGEAWTWLPLPGGHRKFDLLHDAATHTYWQVGSRGVEGVPLGQAVGAEAGLRRLGLWSSQNLVEWRYEGGVVSGGEGAAGIRCDPSAAIHGNDLFIAYRAGGLQSRNSREATRILCRRISNFRSRAH